MPPPRSRRSRRATRRKKQKPLAPSATNSTNFEEQLAHARHLEESGQSTQAASIYEKLLVSKPKNGDLHEELATLYMQCGHADGAEKHFRAAIELQPECGFEKYAYLAQILGNTEEALSLARKGVELIQAESSKLSESSSNKTTMNIDENNVETKKDRQYELREYEASAQCAIAEIALGIIEDSNDPDVASRMDSQVEQAIMAALAGCESGSSAEIEATVTLANLRLSQGRKDEARNAMKRVYECVREALTQMEDAEKSEEMIVDAMESLPAMELRIAIGKQLMEVELWSEAIMVLLSVMWECDFNVEVWYMVAVAHWKLGDNDEARNALETTRKLLHSTDGYDGTLEEELIDRLLTKLKSDCKKPSSENDQDVSMKD